MDDLDDKTLTLLENTYNELHRQSCDEQESIRELYFEMYERWQ